MDLPIRKKAALHCLLGMVLLSVLLAVTALAPVAPDPAPDLILGLQASLRVFLPVITWLGWRRLNYWV